MLERYSLTHCISADHPSLAGHFPSNPIVPGVVILDEVVQATRQLTELELLAPIMISTVKFLAPLRPEQAFVIQLELNRAKQRIAFQCLRGQQLLAKGVLKMSNFRPSQSDPRLNALLAAYSEDLFTKSLYQSNELAQRYSLELVRRLLQQLGIAPLLQTKAYTLAAIQQSLAFSAKFETALGWLLDYAASERLIARLNNEKGQVSYSLGSAWSPPQADTLVALRAAGIAIDPANAATLELLDAAAAAWLQVARGTASGTEALLGMGQLNLWLNYFNTKNPLYAANNRLAALSVVKCLAERAPTDGRLRMLEVGAGAGSAALALLEALAKEGLLGRIDRYLITEPNAFFRRRAERALKARYPDLRLEFSGLNIDQDWQDQGAPRDQFDLVYSVNVLHVAKDLRFSLDQACQALRPDGWLIIGECLRPEPGQPVYIELMFQILDSYTEVALDPKFRPTPGFLTGQQWQLALGAVGLRHITIEPPDHDRIQAIHPRFLLGTVCAKKLFQKQLRLQCKDAPNGK